MFKRLKASTIDSLLGKKFFYADIESGVGWESTVDEMFANADQDGYTLELSCGTRVVMSRLDLVRQSAMQGLTNLKEI